MLSENLIQEAEILTQMLEEDRRQFRITPH
jgi:hypothetical protein